MKNFQLITTGNVTPILAGLAANPDLWNSHTIRTTHEHTPHSDVDDILLRFNRQDQTVAEIMDGHESINYPAMQRIPSVRGIIFDLMHLVQGERLGRVIITRLPPGKSITPHVDSGDHAAYYDRFQICLQNAPGSMFHCGDESVYMRQGDVWTFNNAVEHSVVNNSKDDRLALIVDIRTCR